MQDINDKLASDRKENRQIGAKSGQNDKRDKGIGKMQPMKKKNIDCQINFG